MHTATLKDFKILDETPQDAPRLSTQGDKPQPDDYSQRKARAILYVSKATGEAKGNRNAAGYALGARTQEKFDLRDNDLFDVLSDWNQRNNPPLDDAELSNIVRNANKYAKRPAGSGYEPIKRKTKTSPKRKNDTPGRMIKRRCFADIKPKRIDYLIPEILPLGIYVSIISQEGVGKSTLIGKWAADISRGAGGIPQGDVVIFSPEESPEQTIAPRLIANGADMTQIHLGEYIINEDGTEDYFDIEHDIDILEKWADELPELKLIIFDPITSFTGCNENSNSEVRRALKPLVDFAERRNISILGLTHLNKKIDLGMINRTIGSRSWSAVPRMIWGIQAEQIENEDGQKIDTNNRFLLCVKNNLGPKPQGMKFSISDNGRVDFDSQRFDMSMDDGGIQTSRAGEIGEWLIERIGIDAIPANEITTEGCQKWGISKQRLGKIATDAGIHKRRSVAENCWVWSVQR